MAISGTKFNIKGLEVCSRYATPAPLKNSLQEILSINDLSEGDLFQLRLHTIRLLRRGKNESEYPLIKIISKTLFPNCLNNLPAPPFLITLLSKQEL